ncbi:MAG: hypothetical protein GF398_20805 [Chitinivibrionales bacterium]|nr:hypothetical protein [Chitinivibrionales bacterium]
MNNKAPFHPCVFDKEDPDLLWVGNDGNNDGIGTSDQPYPSLKRALDKVRPGQTIVLKSGNYRVQETIDASGTEEKPVTICGESDEVIIEGVSWRLYDVSDFILSNLTFRNVAHNALSVFGQCERNRFEYLHFVNCGGVNTASCAMYFGGAHSYCNIIEFCLFERERVNSQNSVEADNAGVGLMISEGNYQEQERNTNYIVRNNRFKNYDYGIIVGTHDRNTGQYSHLIENNTVESCSLDGISVKCGDTELQGNVITGCMRRGISLSGGNDSILENNRIAECSTGALIAGEYQTVRNNCFVRCRQFGVYNAGNSEITNVPARATMIYSNTSIDCGSSTDSGAVGSAHLGVDAGTSCIVADNLFHGRQGAAIIGNPTKAAPEEFFAKHNALSGGCRGAQGCIDRYIEFSDFDKDNFENSSPFGAHGWVAHSPTAVADHAEMVYTSRDYKEHMPAAKSPKLADSVIEDVNKETLYSRSMLPRRNCDT